MKQRKKIIKKRKKMKNPRKNPRWVYYFFLPGFSSQFSPGSKKSCQSNERIQNSQKKIRNKLGVYIEHFDHPTPSVIKKKVSIPKRCDPKAICSIFGRHFSPFSLSLLIYFFFSPRTLIFPFANIK